MASRYTETDSVNLDQVIKELQGIYDKKINVGPAAEENSELAKAAAANEFGAEIKAKNGKSLAIPITTEAKGRSPQEFGKDAGKHFIFVKRVVIPERAFMRITADSKETMDRAERIAGDAISRVIEGKGKGTDVLNAIGFSLVASVKRTISSNLAPPNSWITLMTKRQKSNTLINEARLLNSIQHEVTNAG